MPRIAHSGRSRISIRRPSALGECDRCGLWHNLDAMTRQFQWAGNSLMDTGLLVGRDCLDVPQQQFRAPILPADPYPRFNPRPSPATTGIPYIGGPLPTSPENQGFTQYVLGASTQPFGYPTPAGVLAAVAQNSGVPTPPASNLATYIVPMAGYATVPLVPANSDRTFLLIFNPTQFPAQISFGQAVQGGLNNLSIGPQEAYFWSTAQGLAPVYLGALTAVGLFPAIPLWAWEDSSGLIINANLVSDGGVLALDQSPVTWPTSPIGLPVGSIWNNGLAVSVVPGATPNPMADPVFFGSITAAALLALGGGDLPVSDPHVALQLWNNGGVVSVSFGQSNLGFATYQDGSFVLDQNGNKIPIF